MAFKVCSKCKENKEPDNFHKNKNKCKNCRKIERKEYYNKNKVKEALYYDLNKDRISDYKKSHYIMNKEDILNRMTLYRESNKVELKRYHKDYYKDNKAIINKRSYQYKKNRLNDDVLFKVREKISHSVYSALKSNSSSKSNASCFSHLPFTKQELKEHIEALFEPWMSWDNWGVYKVSEWDDEDSSTWKWQIDHIKPHSSFKYTSMEDKEFEACWSLDNLRPLSAKENLLKGDKYDY